MVNKKGFKISPLVDMYAYATFILIIIIFFGLFQVSKFDRKSAQIKGAISDSIAAGEILTLYLNSPQEIYVGGYLLSSEMTFPEFISSAVYSQDERIKVLLESKTEDFIDRMNSLYHTDFKINIYIEDSVEPTYSSPWISQGILVSEPLASAVLPLNEFGNFAIVTVYKELRVDSYVA